MSRPAKAKQRLLVVAGNRRQYDLYLRARGLKDRVDATYVGHSMQLVGIEEAKVVFTGTYTDRDDFDAIADTVNMLDRHCTIAHEFIYK